jgi:phage regulator Rha-like protein
MNSLSIQTQQTMLSTEVAELTKKQHPHVLRDIDVIIEQLKDNPNLDSDFKSTAYLAGK